MLSVHPRFANGILAGTKRVELRRRSPRVADAVVLYATSPVKAVVGAFTIESIVRLPLGLLWRQVRGIAEVTRAEYLDYFNGLTEGVGIFVGHVVSLDRPVPLPELRRLWPGFHPPQGFQYLGDSEYKMLACRWQARKAG
ncbi:MAG: hypothetical protein ACYC35_15220 [Pirellulales bacterium]